MPANKRSNGNWGKKQDKQLGDLIRANIVDHNERRPAELFRITQTHFPDFISPGDAGKRAANQRLQNKLVNYGIDLENRRGGGEFGMCLYFSINPKLNAHITASFLTRIWRRRRHACWCNLPPALPCPPCPPPSSCPRAASCAS